MPTPTHQFLAYSSDHGLASAWLTNIFAAAGDTLTVSTSVPFDLTHLEQYDGVFLAGPVNGLAPDNDVLVDYVRAGGNIYLEGGTGDFGTAAGESQAWSTFTNAFGLSFSQTFDDEPAYTDTITGTSPLFNGVTSLYEWGTSPIELSTPINRSAQIIEYSPSGYGEYAVYDPDGSADQLVPVTAQVDADNHYGLFTGNADGSGLSFIGRNEVGPAGSPGAFNWSDAETWNFDMSTSQYIYGVAWDGSTGGAWFMGQFALPNGQTLTTNSGDWQYAYGGDDGEFDTPQGSDYDAVPVSTDVSSWIATADNSGGWMTPVAVGNGAPDGTTRVPEIGTNVDALWTTSFNTDYSSFIVFRAKLPSPQTIYPANSAATVTGLSGRTVYVDSNDNGQLDPGEPSTVTGAGGEYALTNVPAGNAIVREVLPTGWTQTQPTGGEGYDVTVAPGQQLKDYNFVTQLGTGTSNQPPTATFADSGQIYEGGSGSLAFTNVVGAGPITYAFSFNDNGTWDVTGSSPTATIPASYLVAPGTFKMEGEISNAFGSTTYTTTVEVEDVAPVPVISGGAPPYTAGTPVNLTGSSSGPGDDDSAELDWSVTKNGVPFGSTGTGTSYSFTPNGNGTFEVTLEAINGKGTAGTCVTMIQIGGGDGGGNITLGPIVGDPPDVELVPVQVDGSYEIPQSTLNGALTAVLIAPPDDSDDPYEAGTDYSEAMDSTGGVRILLPRPGPYTLEVTRSEGGTSLTQEIGLLVDAGTLGVGSLLQLVPWGQYKTAPIPNDNVVALSAASGARDPEGSLSTAANYLQGIEGIVPRFSNIDDLIAEAKAAYEANGYIPITLAILDHGDAGTAGIGSGALFDADNDEIGLGSDSGLISGSAKFEQELTPYVSRIDFLGCNIGGTVPLSESPFWYANGPAFLQGVAAGTNAVVTAYSATTAVSYNAIFGGNFWVLKSGQLITEY